PSSRARMPGATPDPSTPEHNPPQRRLRYDHAVTQAFAIRESSAMKIRMLAMAALALVTYIGIAHDSSLSAQTDEKYVVNKDWAKLPPGMTWDASTSAVAADGKGSIVVFVRTAPFFRMFT